MHRLHGMPTIYHACLEVLADGGDATGPRLRRVYSGGSALPVPVLGSE